VGADSGGGAAVESEGEGAMTLGGGGADAAVSPV